MAQRNELTARAAAVGVTAANYPNDSKLEQKVLFLEKNGTTYTETLGSGTLTTAGADVAAADTFTIGNRTYTFRATALTGVRASSTLTNATSFSDGETVTVAGKQYTFKTTLTTPQTPNQVLIGANVSASFDNLKAAINGATGAGSTYSSDTTAHSLVFASTKAGTTLLVVARDMGTAPNSYDTAETGATASWTGTTLSGGVANAVDEILIQASAAVTLDVVKEAVNSTNTMTVTSASATVGATYGVDGSVVIVNATIAGQTTLVVNSVNGIPMPASGTLTKISGTGDATIAYSAIIGIEGKDFSSFGGPHTQVTATTNAATSQLFRARQAAFDNAKIATTTTGGGNSVFGGAIMASGVRGVIVADTGASTGSAGLSGDANVI